MPVPRASTALSRFTILDLTRVRSGPTAVRQLADWGANVVKIEMPETGEGGDQAGGPRSGPDFQNLHRNKRSITLNLKAPEGIAIFRRLVERADVVVENFRPDVKDRLGIDYAALERINPRIVYASISGFGQDGPYRDRPGFDQIAQGMGGLMSITGLPGQGPVRVGIPVADLCAGLFCAHGIMVALLERESSGRIPTGVFRTADGHINIATTGQKIWERFCRAIGAEDLLADPAYATSAERSANRDALNADIDRRLAADTSAGLIAKLNAAGVPCGPIYAIDEVFADPQVEHLAIAQPATKSGGAVQMVVGQPVLLSRTPSSPACATPELGEHTDEVLREFGFDECEIQAARAARAI
jgi:formyl-CoA transferase